MTSVGRIDGTRRARILVTAELDTRAMERLHALGDVRTAGWGVDRTVLVGPRWRSALADADIVIVEFEKIEASDIVDAPGLQLVAVARGTQQVTDVAALTDRKSTRLNSSHIQKSRMPSSA